MTKDNVKMNQFQIGKDIRVELQIPPSPIDDLTTPRRGGGLGLGVDGLPPLSVV
jgi:hypothetical protein